MLDNFIGHGSLVAFADQRVNLKREDVKDYRLQVGRLREKLKAYIDDHSAFDLVKMLHSGSVAKGTALKTINDMDVAVYVKAGSAPVEENELLKWLAARLLEAYGDTIKSEQISTEHHCVTVDFKGSSLHVDVVPVLYEGDPDDRGYLITKDSGQRVLTSIPLHLQFTRARKDQHKTHYRQMVRLVKWWARQQKAERAGFRFKSFMAELLLAHLFDKGVISGNYVDGLSEFFAYIVRTQLNEQIAFSDYYNPSTISASNAPIRIYDPVNASNNVAALYTSSDRDTIVRAAEEALEAIAYGRRATSKGEAVNAWQEVLGTSFRGDA